MAERESHLTKDVFVAGAQPVVTYNPRDERHLEQELAMYLDQGPGRALTVYGPTKSGKTVLVERQLPRDETIWVEGPDLKSVDDFWERIVDWLGLYDLVEVTRQEATGTGQQMGIGLDAKFVSANLGKKNDNTQTTGVRKGRTQAITSVARDALETVKTTIVIDDFHYVSEEAKRELVRGIKTVIKFCKVILIAVPHEAFATIRNEPDMNGRVSLLGIDVWAKKELQFIAERGFQALNVTDAAGVGAALAERSYGAPFLMQDLCYQYVITVLRLYQTAPETLTVSKPPDWTEFLQQVANRTPSPMFEALLKGPKIRGQEREPRVFKSGETTDIYGMLLHAIAKVGKPTVSHREIVKVVEQDFKEVPGGSTITAALGQMSKIAMTNREDSDAVVAYKNDALHILDPFLLLYLRYGTWTVVKEIRTRSGQQELSISDAGDS
jgi:hypothetical protein